MKTILRLKLFSIMQNQEHRKRFYQSLGLAWLVWGLAATYYFSDYMARVAPGVMHQSLQTAFGLSEAGFGLLTYSFYIPYILMQIPVGIIVDRFSVRRLLSVMSVVTAIGCLLFGLSSNLMLACFGRMLIGFSAAFAFISSLRLATAWFPPAMLGLLAGLTQALGMLGAAAGEEPIRFLESMVGWRHAMLVLAILFLVLAFFLYRYIQDHESMQGEKSQAKITVGIFEALKQALSQRQIWVNALYAGCLFGPTAVIGESYGPAFLQYGWGLGAHESAFAIGLIFIGWGVGGPLLGWLSDRAGVRKPYLIFSSLATFSLTVLMVYFPVKNLTYVYGLFFIFGLTNSGVGIAYAISTELSKRQVMGAAIAFTNMASIFVGASLQPLVGHWIDIIAGERSYHVSSLTINDFQKPLSVLIVCSACALILAFCIKETHCQNVNRED